MTYFLFLLFPFVSRAIIYVKKRREMGYWLPGWLIGIAQDLFIASVLIGLTHLGIPFFITALFLVYHLVDAFLLMACDFRMKLIFFKYLFEFKDFQSSAIEMGIRFFSVILVLSYVGLCSLSWILPFPPTFSLGITIFTLVGGLLAITYKGKMYLYGNVLFQEAVNALSALVEKKEKPEQLSVILPQCEKSKSLSPRYPLLKMTEGFVGEKLFNIQIGKEEKPHVILIALESFGAKYLKSGATPHLDQLAKEGISYTHFHAAGIPTSRSLHATLFGIHPDLDSLPLQERNPLYPLIGIQDILKANDYRTLYHKGGSLLFLNAIKYLKNHGFDELAGDEEVMETLQKGDRTSWGVHDTELFDYSFQRLQQLDKENTPTFMMICTISNHHPWQVPEGFIAPNFAVDSPLMARYLQTVYYTDAALGGFINKLKESGISKNSVILITADNGQPMGEHEDNYMPLKEVYEENHHIPLLIVADGKIKTPTSIDAIGSQIDLMPTMMDMLSLTRVNHSIGTSLMRKAPERRAFCVSTHILPYISHNQGDYKYCLRIDTDHRELFNLKEDPEEKTNIIHTHSHIAEKLHTQLIQHFTSLQKLYRGNCITPATDKSIILLGDSEEVTDQTLLQKAEKHTTLTSILISDCDQITDKGFAQLMKKVDHIEFLYLNNVPLTGKSLEAIEEKAKRLKELTLSHSVCMPSESMTHLLSSCPRLEDLTLSGNIHVDDEVLKTIAKSCPKLQNLELSDCFGITERGFEALSHGCQNLNRLNLNGLTSVTDHTLKMLSKGSYDLHTLHLLDCTEITGEGVWHICNKSPNLQRLSFRGDAVDNETIHKIANRCPEIMKLLITGCEQFSSDGFISIAKSFKNLTILELANCPNLTDTFFEYLADKPLGNLLIAGAPLLTDQSLPHIQKLSTLNTLTLYHCPQITQNALFHTGTLMSQTGSLYELRFNRARKVYYHASLDLESSVNQHL